LNYLLGKSKDALAADGAVSGVEDGKDRGLGRHLEGGVDVDHHVDLILERRARDGDMAGVGADEAGKGVGATSDGDVNDDLLGAVGIEDLEDFHRLLVGGSGVDLPGDAEFVELAGDLLGVVDVDLGAHDEDNLGLLLFGGSFHEGHCDSCRNRKRRV